MNVLIPMAGAGKRFSDAGYTVHKPLIPTTYLYDGHKYPMVVCAVKDIFRITGGSKVIFLDRTDNSTYSEVRESIKQCFSESVFIGVDHLTEGQASTCLLARELIDNDESLFIGGCDNGMSADRDKFSEAAERADVLIFTYRHNDCVLEKPDAYGWVITKDSIHASGVSVKKAISEDPVNDHAIVSSFWFKKGSHFVLCADKMIEADDRINGEFYVDKVMSYCIDMGLNVEVFEIDRYLGWGTPEDYENYELTVEYWRRFLEKEKEK